MRLRSSLYLTLLLADGTQLTVSRAASPGMNTPGLTEVDATALPDCALCYRSDPLPQLVRTRINSALLASSTIALGDLTLSVSGQAPRRIRWDVMELP